MTTGSEDLVTDRVIDLYRAHLGPGRARVGEMLGGRVEVESDGAWIGTADGDRYLNAGGYGVFIMGSRHPLVLAEVRQQLDRHPVGSRMFLEPTAARAAQLLASVTPPGLDRVHFSGSGTEAVEAAIKIARLSGHHTLISMHGGYHGKTMGALSLTARSVFQDPFRPLLPDVIHVPYDDIPALTEALRAHPGTASVFVEPVQGEGGVVIPAPGYLSTVRALCTEYGALLVADEIQTGLGRLGAWWGCDREDVVPDILLSGKALGGGVLPVAATIAAGDAFARLDRDPFLHTSTFSAAPVAMAAVCGAIAAVREDGLVERAAALGARLTPALEEIALRHLGSRVKAVRGCGLLIGIEFAEPGMAGALLIDLVDNNVIGNFSLNADNVLRLTPPAILSAADEQFLLDRFERAAITTADYYPER
ncbi:aspartate aminotransferase family protein [Nocardia aurantia]|uniref:Putrescine aminotransferase n=1 Tax=Nocardia aurantia TaxID=2585199 RepID=A0A7K0DKV4_9NOCA|nr:aminotransferase class III-fold pyridoxal phosphate-dependent enzyme [Nocardia aurantia]MQY26406.1 Putrescine aminotransferase [Nocardia aurantia]